MRVFLFILSAVFLLAGAVGAAPLRTKMVNGVEVTLTQSEDDKRTQEEAIVAVEKAAKQEINDEAALIAAKEKEIAKRQAMQELESEGVVFKHF